MCPQARREVNHQFHRTLEQALSKYLQVTPRVVLLNSRYTNHDHGVDKCGDIDNKLKRKILQFLQQMPE